MTAQVNLLEIASATSRPPRAGSPHLALTHGMAGCSPPMQRVYQFVDRVAHSDATVLIQGESGTGKELVARAIHNRSARSGGPLIAINCAALPESLLESELFGHTRGAFTGALAERKGRFELADGGTLFLDEIGEMPLALQAKLLRVLQEREFERVGGTRTVHVDVRVVAATNVDLRAAAEAGTFRKDLYYRLDVVSISIPPLRERREDIAMLAAHFVEHHGMHLTREVTGIGADALACLMSYSWPGNVRELQNAIQHALVLGASETISAHDLPFVVISAAPLPHSLPSRSYRSSVRVFKQQLIQSAIREAEGNLTVAANLLHVHPNYLHRLIRALGLRDTILRRRGSDERSQCVF